jgi:hypothetical protein
MRYIWPQPTYYKEFLKKSLLEVKDWHKEFVCEFLPTLCVTQDSNGNHCPNEPKYRKDLDAMLCNDCYMALKERKIK